MRETFSTPDGDPFQIITEHRQGQLIADRNFMGAERPPDGFIRIQMFLSRASDSDQAGLYQRIVERLAASPGIRADDVMIVLTEVGLDDWSFGRGEAQHILHPPASAKKESVLA